MTVKNGPLSLNDFSEIHKPEIPIAEYTEYLKGLKRDGGAVVAIAQREPFVTIKRGIQELGI